MIFSRNRNCGASPLIILFVIAALLYVLFGKEFTSPPNGLRTEEKREQHNQKRDREAVRVEIEKLKEKKLY